MTADGCCFMPGGLSIVIAILRGAGGHAIAISQISQPPSMLTLTDPYQDHSGVSAWGRTNGKTGNQTHWWKQSSHVDPRRDYRQTHHTKPPKNEMRIRRHVDGCRGAVVAEEEEEEGSSAAGDPCLRRRRCFKVGLPRLEIPYRT